VKRGWTLASCGLLLVGVPFACQLLLVVFLLSGLSSACDQLALKYHSRAVISEALALSAEMTESGALLCSSSDLLNDKTVTKSVSRAKEHLGRFVAFLKRDKIPAAYGENLSAAAENVFAMAERSKNNPDGGRQDNVNVTTSVDAFQAAVDKIVDWQRTRGSTNAATIRLLREKTTFVLSTSLVVNVCLAIVLALFYAITIRRSLNRIKINSRLLSKQQPLLPPLKGGDELSHLDRLLHRAVGDVNTALSREKALVDHAADLICSLDQQAKFTSVNPFATRMLGYLTDEMIGKSLFDFVSQEDMSTAQELVAKAMSAGATHATELRLRKKNGAIIDTKWSCLWSELERSLFCVVHDITEQKRIEDLKQDFVNMVSHDLRSPLTSLFGSLKLVAAGAKGPLAPSVEAEVSLAANNVGKLVVFVNDLLDFQKLRVGKMQLNVAPCDLEDIIEEAAAFLRAVADVKSVEIVIPRGHFLVRCDKPKMLQTVTNLLSNAIKFAPEQSSINVEVAEFPHLVQVSVRDTGPGVPEQFRDRIFEAFEQAPSAGLAAQGTGLGLAICKLIVEAHGGTIGVTSVTEEDLQVNPLKKTTGSTFWFRIPK
jgi:PAS domain S-box-containing protein